MHPLQIDIDDAGRALGIQWQDGTTSRIPSDVLRSRCECVECKSQGRGIGPTAIPLVTEAAQTIREVHLVDSSTLLVIWADGHSKSYFSFRTLRKMFPPSSQNSIA